MAKKFYITTPIYYVNDRVHVGHAYTTVAADVLARYYRLAGDRVFFLTGADEHGAKVEAAIKQSGKKPREFVDEMATAFKAAWQKLSINYDNFIRTTNPDHIKAVEKVLETLYQAGFIYPGDYEGLYCIGCEQYKSKDDLVDGKCPDHEQKPVLMKEESYFFKLSQFEEILENKISSDELQIEPIERKNEVLSFIRSGLKDVSISRKNVKWGIPLPFDKRQTTYVWIDAFLNYLTGLGWDGNPSNIKHQTSNIKFWPPDVQLMSKDILRVHATIWPAMLLAIGLPLPNKLFAHGYFTINSQKMSKSLGNVIWPEKLVEKFGVDGARYLLMSSLTYGRDGDVSWEKLIEKYNADLANGLGNLISRVFNLIENNFGGKIRLIPNVDLEIENQMRNLELSEALQRIKEKIDWANQYIDETKIWNLVKTDKKKAEKVLAELLGVIIKVGKCLMPFMPETAKKILQGIQKGKIKKGEALFPRIN